MNIQKSNRSITSLEIAEMSGKNHKDVMKSIRNMESSWEKVNGRKFALVEYLDGKGEKRPMYSLNMDESLYVASKYNDETRAKIIKHWSELRMHYSVFGDLQKAILPAIAEHGKVSTEVDRLYFKLAADPDFITYQDLLERKRTLDKVIKEYQKATQVANRAQNILDKN